MTQRDVERLLELAKAVEGLTALITRNADVLKAFVARSGGASALAWKIHER